MIAKTKSIPDREAIVTYIKGEIADILRVDLGEIEEENSLKELGLDSLDLVELTMFIEDHYDIEINDERLENITTIDDFANLVTDHLSGKPVC